MSNPTLRAPFMIYICGSGTPKRERVNLMSVLKTNRRVERPAACAVLVANVRWQLAESGDREITGVPVSSHACNMRCKLTVGVSVMGRVCVVAAGGQP